jgi:hypothetical protein
MASRYGGGGEGVVVRVGVEWYGRPGGKMGGKLNILNKKFDYALKTILNY